MNAAGYPDELRPRVPKRGLSGFYWVVALLVAGALSWGTLDTPWVAEDAAILARVSETGPTADFMGPQYGLHLLRFWRPVVSLSWWVQEHSTGIDPIPLRLFNLLLLGLTVILLGHVVRLLGGGRLVAILSGVLAATFPAQGGTVTWLAGRTDGLVAVFFVAALVAALQERRWLAAGLVFLACGSKEFAFVLPAWIALIIWAKEHRTRAAWEATWPAGLVALGALGLRRLAVGSFMGGYVGGADRISAANLLYGIYHGLQGLAPALILLACLVAVGAWAGTWRWRVVVAGLGCALAGIAPLLPLLVLAPLGPQNVRLFWVAEIGLVVSAAGACLRMERASGWRLAVLLAVLSVGLGLRGASARSDVLEWSQAGWVGENAIQVARQRAALGEPGQQPLLWGGFPGTYRGAYCLGFGLADRFRAPFPTSARPVWPLRSLFVDNNRLRPRIARPDAEGFGDPFDLPSRRVPRLDLWLDGVAQGDGKPSLVLEVDERVPVALVDRSPRIEVGGARPNAPLEIVLLTEAGLESVLAGAFDAEGRATFSLTELCRLSNSVSTIGQALFQVADLSATCVYLELRSLDESGKVTAACLPLRMEWQPDLLDKLDL